MEERKIYFGSAFPFEGNWNFLMFYSHPIQKEPLDPLSRLKGIETGNPSVKFRLALLAHFGSAFPFEGNWNVAKHASFWSDFHFGSAFPFEGNWNVCNLDIHITSVFFFGSAFPFEGNWNTYFAAALAWQLGSSLDMLSRLKGIETRKWTKSQLRDTLLLWIRFPVWRELKLDVMSRSVKRSYLWIRFPVWRELKQECLVCC